MVVVTTSNFAFGSRARALFLMYWPPPSALVDTVALVDTAMSIRGAAATTTLAACAGDPLAFARQSRTILLLLQT
jgi:hypothetical protein